ncbi:acyl-CoA thioesterase domain-containing protein [Amycolatopsis rubida]|uniref:Thioesterase-like superfamily protein n=1 Tax=Amycolatopsis rubida TaxID=112413 RepID=A0A1I5TDN6_9PSEU|nr:acyl-CoA thioesterase domain-containing protein [Amycolatopsis rubida]SFP80546.1 Thioesterase-like superfamily protein [Amycolatopsis rubida]
MAFFTAEPGPDGELLHPLPEARASWGGGAQLRGMATSGALARAAERAAGPGLFRPARWTVDLLRPARYAPAATRTEIVRRGRRLCLVEATLWQGETLVGKGSGLFLAAGSPSAGRVWAPDGFPAPPPFDVFPETEEPRVFHSEGVGWTGSPEPHQNASRKTIWVFPQDIVRGERPTPFQHAATAADLVNLVTNWGEAGLEFINADLTLTLGRVPASDLELGLAADHRVEHDGIAVTTATVFDRAGPLGTVSGTALLAAAPVDPRRVGAPESVPTVP